MVIQSNMSPKAIVDVWGITAPIFEKYKVPLTTEAMETFIEADVLVNLQMELNHIVESSTATCIEGG